MLRCSARLVGTVPISFSAAIQSKKNTGESNDAFEERTWRERMHVDEKGHVFIPGGALKHCLVDCAKYLQETVAGKGKATWTKYFQAGMMIEHDLSLGINADKVPSVRLFLPSDGKPGGSSKVWKYFPIIPKWEATADIILLDPLLIDRPQKVHEFLRHAGLFIGLGRWRPRVGGSNGRFKVAEFTTEKISLDDLEAAA